MTNITLPPICDRAAARAVHQDLLSAIGDAKVTIDASAVERIGQAMMQVLVSATKTASGAEIETPSDAFLTAISLAGLEASLGSTNEEARAA